MTTEPDKPKHASGAHTGAEEWEHLRGNVRHQTVGMIEEIFALLRILLQDAVILVAGFAVEFAFEHWLHSEQPAFRMALNISSILFLLLYCVMVTVHFVRYLREQVGTITPGTPSTASGAHVAGEAAAKMPAGSRRYIAVGIAAAVAVAIVVGAIIYLRRGGLSGHGSAGTNGEQINSLAVLALENSSGDPENEYLGDGISESLISSLSQLPQLKVMSRDSAFSYKGKQVEVDAIGQQLDVGAVFKGQVKQIGDSLMVSVELIDTADKHQIWGQQYLRKASDIFALQQEIARDISDKLKLKLSGESQQKLAKRGTENTEAYQAYIKGRFWWNKRSEEGFKKAIEFFQQAIANDPAYALAYSGLADTYYGLENYTFASGKEILPKAKEAALRAVQLDDTLAEAHTSLAQIALVYDLDRPTAEREFKRAMELDPNYASAHQWYGQWFLGSVGKLDEGLAELKHAQKLDPLSVTITRVAGELLGYARQYDAAMIEDRKAIELDPESAGARRQAARTYLGKKMYPEAIRELEKSVELAKGSSQNLGQLGYAYAVGGRRADAQRVLDTLLAQSKKSFVQPLWVALIYVGLGDKDRAFEWMEKAFEERSSSMMLIKVAPWWDPLRDDPRYHDLLRRMNLE
jgi:TolB-like protein/Tfp pilus assembly protein PilF